MYTTSKWLPGVIKEKSGPVSYSVQLEDGRTWHRHADHIRQRYATMGPSGQVEPSVGLAV